MDHLSTFRTGRAIKEALTCIPLTLSDKYIDMFDHIPTSDRQIVRETLMLLCFSIRPLRLDELAEAVILQEGDNDLDEDSRLSLPEVLLDICQGFIDVDGDGAKLVHDSVRSFLTSDLIKESKVAFFALNAEACHQMILQKCVTYLSFREFAKGRAIQEQDLDRRVKCYPFVPYAALYWPIHAESTSLRPKDEQLLLSFFATKKQIRGGCFDSWVQFLIPDAGEESIAETEPLYYAASYSMLSILRLLLRPENNVDIEQRGGRFGSTPLYVACYQANLEAARLLLEAGADPDASDEPGITCRDMAESDGLDELVVLIDEKKKKARDLLFWVRNESLG
jgi:ankyrin repeat protein